MIGKRFILGFSGLSLPTWVEEFATQFELGGVILFDYDYRKKSYGNNVESPEQLKKLCAAIHDLSGGPLVYVDQEGGKVRRLKEKTGFKPLPSHEELARLPIADRKKILRESFREMKQIGIDVNLAPVIDINYFAKNPDIGAIGRSFSARMEVVRDNALLFFEVAELTGVQLCLKHYPGLGGATTNSHEELTDITDSIAEEQLELFYDLGRDVPGSMILLSHGKARNWDEKYPVSVSEKAVNDLRKRLPHSVLLSDDIQMQGLQKLMSTKDAVKRCLAIGVDRVIIGNNLLDEQEQCFSIASALA